MVSGVDGGILIVVVVVVVIVPPQTVRFKNELERNITIKLGYANAKIFKAVEGAVPGPGNFRLVLHSLTCHK